MQNDKKIKMQENKRNTRHRVQVIKWGVISKAGNRLG